MALPLLVSLNCVSSHRMRLKAVQHNSVCLCRGGQSQANLRSVDIKMFPRLNLRAPGLQRLSNQLTYDGTYMTVPVTCIASILSRGR